MSIRESRDELKAILSECVRRAALRNAYVQMTCTRGVPKPGSRDPRECINQLTCFAQPFVWIANEAQREQGLSMIVSSTQRIPPEAVDPRFKNFHWLDLTMAVFAMMMSAMIASRMMTMNPPSIGEVLSVIRRRRRVAAPTRA